MPNGTVGLNHDWEWIEALDAQDRTKDGLKTAIRSLHRGADVAKAARAANVSVATLKNWRNSYPEFNEEVKMTLDVAQRSRSDLALNMRVARLDQKGLVLPYTPTFPEDKPGLVDFSRIYMGRPSEPHHVAVSKMWEDKTNTKMMVLMPTGGGKDTKANDAIIHATCDDRGLLRSAFILENDEFAKRRLSRLTRYLTDDTLYTIPPIDTEGATTPTRSLIDDYGPFKWQRGMVYPNGDEVARPVWNAHKVDFVGSTVNEADPQLWATGLGGDLYGTRLRLVVLSDIFTQKNQSNPSMRFDQMSWVRGTFESRLDGRGRVLILGTMLLEENNYEEMHDEYAAGAGIVYADEYYTKYRNGFAVVRYPAIMAEGTERERSYWEARFPYRTKLVLYGNTGIISEQVDAHTLTDDEYMEKSEDGWSKIDGLVEQRGEVGTERWKQFQATHQQIRVSDAEQVDFTDDILDLADDPDRSWGTILDHEIAVQGVDPASKYGAGTVVLAVDRQARTITPVYSFWDENLGIAGIKAKLVMNPALVWMPTWLVYEINKHEAVLEDSEVRLSLKQMGVNVHPHKTTPHNRNSLEIGPAGLVALMRARVWRWPMATQADREKTSQVKAHFKAWDRHEGTVQRKSKPGQAGHAPDDLCMAAWIASIKAVVVLDQGQRRTVIRQAVPPSVLKRWEKYNQGRNATKDVKEADQVWHDGQGLERLISIASGNDKEK